MKLTVNQHANILAALYASVGQPYDNPDLEPLSEQEHYELCERIVGDGLAFWEPLEALLAAINDYGTRDIYTDAPEYSNATTIAHNLAGLAGVACGGTVSCDDVEAAMEVDDEETPN